MKGVYWKLCNNSEKKNSKSAYKEFKKKAAGKKVKQKLWSERLVRVDKKNNVFVRTCNWKRTWIHPYTHMKQKQRLHCATRCRPWRQSRVILEERRQSKEHPSSDGNYLTKRTYAVVYCTLLEVTSPPLFKKHVVTVLGKL